MNIMIHNRFSEELTNPKIAILNYMGAQLSHLNDINKALYHFFQIESLH